MVMTTRTRMHECPPGGFVASGFQLGYSEIAAVVGDADARMLWGWVREAGNVLRERARVAGCPLEPIPTLEVGHTCPHDRWVIMVSICAS